MPEMNVTPVRASLTPQIWDGKYFAEYIRKNRFARYMGKTATSMIQVKDDFGAKAGDTVTFATIRRLVGAGVTGNTVLEGNEEILDQRSMKLVVAPSRHAVAVSEWDETKSSIELRQAAKDALQNWSLERLRSDIIVALSSINGTPYAASTVAQRNAWLTANADRVLFGEKASNGASGVHATALSTVSPATGRMSGKLLSLAKRRAVTASPHIRPIQVDDENDEEWFVVFMPSLAFRDFRADPEVVENNREARERGTDNPLFTGGDLLHDGMIIREIPELPVLTGVGAPAGTTPSDVAPVFLCGAQAIGAAWAQRTKTTTNVRDYGFFHGVGLQEIRGIGKLRFGKDATDESGQLVDQGIATIYVSAPPDA